MFIQFFLNRISIYELNGIQDYYKNKYFFSFAFQGDLLEAAAPALGSDQ